MILASLLLAAQEIDFERQILPILSDNCFACHGPDPKNRKADLRLDDEKAAKAEAIIPGKAAESPAFQRISTSDPDDLMHEGKSIRSVVVF